MTATTATSSTHAATAAPPGTRAQAMREGRHADSARRRQRVTAALDRATAQGAEINVSAVAHATRRGFETGIPLPGPAKFVAARAISASGATLARSKVVRVR